MSLEGLRIIEETLLWRKDLNSYWEFSSEFDFFRVTFVNCIFSCVMHNVYVTEIYLPVRVTPFIDTCYSNVLNS